MTRVYRVNKSRKEQHCIRGHAIPVGSPYSYATPGFRGRTIYACAKHPFRPSQLTANDLLSQYYAAVEELEDVHDGWDGKDISELKDAIDNARSTVGDLISEWESQLDSMGDLAQGDTGQIIQERHDYAEEWQQELGTAESDLDQLEDDFDPAEARGIVEGVIAASNL